MKNKNVKGLVALSLMVLLMSQVSMVYSVAHDVYNNLIVLAPTATEGHAGDTKQVITNDDSSGSNNERNTVIYETPNVKDTKKTNKKEESIVKKDSSVKKVLSKKSVTFVSNNDYSSKGFTWDQSDPNTEESHQVVTVGGKDTYYNQVVVKKSGTPHMLKKGDRLDVTTVATMLDGVSALGTVAKQATTYVTAIPKTGYVNANDNGSVVGTNISQYYTSKIQNASDLNSMGVDTNPDPKLTVGKFTSSWDLSNSLGKVTMPADFPFVEKNILGANQDYTYSMGAQGVTAGGTTKAKFGDHINPGEHIYATYHIIYQGSTKSEKGSVKTAIGAFGMDSDQTNFTMNIYDPLEYDGVQISNIDLSVVNGSGNESVDKAMTYSDDADLQKKTIDYTGKWDTSGSDKVDIYYRINPSSDDTANDLSNATKLADSAVDQTKKTFTTSVSANDNYKFKNGENNIVFYAKAENDNASDVGEISAKAYFKLVENHAPVVKDVQLNPTTMEEKSEKDINVTGKYSDEDGDDVSLQYKIDDGTLKDVTNQDTSKTQVKAAKEIAAYQKKMNAKPTVVKKSKMLSSNFYRGVQQPLVGENDTTVIQDDSGQLTYKISLEKSGQPSQTTVGDEITVHARVTADAPQKTKINGQDAYMRLLNSGFFFPFESENGTNGKPLLEEMNSGNGTGGLYSADGTQIAPITTFKQGDDSFDDVTGIGPTWEYGFGGALSGYTIKGTTSYEAEPVDQVYSNTQFTNKGKIINYPKPGIAGQKTNTVNGVPTSAAYVAFRNKMKKTDYLEFTYKYKVGEGAEGLSPNDLRFYAGVYDVSGDSNFQYFRNYIGKSLPGTVINSLSITPDQTEYNDEVLAKDLSNYTKAMTGKYIDSSGAETKVQYEINPTGTTPSGNAKDANISNGTYSANVTGNWKFGVNTVRFFITSSDKKNSSYSDVTVNLTEKIDPDKDFSFTIPKEEIQALNDKEVGQHTIHVYASDGRLTSQEVKDVTTGDFEVTVIPNTAPVADKLTDADGKTLATITEGINTDYGMKLTWHDDDGDAVTGQYTINQSSNGATIATGNIDELDNKGTSNVSAFNIAGSDMAKLKGDEDYTVTVKINDGKAESKPSPIYMLIVKPKPSLELPEKLSFKEVMVGSTRQLDLRDTGWNQIKRNGNSEVTVQQTTPWTANGVTSSLSPIEMINSDDEYNNHRGTPIDDKAVAVKFKADGTLDWIDQDGLLQPIGTESLAGNYSTELTWTITDAAK